MKMLTIGIDGGDKRIIHAMPMPALHRLLAESTCLDVEEDLWSRGWAKILSGVPGMDSGAFYAKPKLDGSHETTQKFSVSDYCANPEITLLWKRLSDSGYKVGFMNLPTTIPAQKVKGFFISGAGGGFNPKDGLPNLACYPAGTYDYLKKVDYIWERRFQRGYDKDFDVFLDELYKTIKNRTEAFSQLCKEYEVQFGFIMHKATTIVQNIAISEIDELIKNKGNPYNLLQEKIVHFYSCVDEQIGQLISVLSPQELILVSDHGQSPRLYSVNVNDWLLQAGIQAPSPRSANSFKKTAQSIARFLPQSLKSGVSRFAPGVKEKVVSKFNVDWGRTIAFGIHYVPGIYINDKKRFNGPVASEKQKDTLVDKLIDRFNNDENAKKHGLCARKYRQQYIHAKYEAFLPDIWIDHPDTYFFEQHGHFIEPNTDYGPIASMDQVGRDMYTGIKGRHPLLCVSPGLAGFVYEEDERDLTLAYKIIVRGMGV